MRLSRPTSAIFAISVILAVLAAVVVYTTISIPVVSGHAFDVLLIAFVLLAAGNVMRGL